jgi:cytochrome c
MFKSIKTIATVIALTLVLAMNAHASKYNIGEAASNKLIAGWDIDIRPDGQGLPPGSGSVKAGETLYEAQCASCHGVFGEGEGRWPVLAGGEDSLTEDKPEKTVGSYWPYLSTLWDYIHRAMPFFQPQSLSDDEVYAITAYILYLNELVDEDFTLSKENFTSVKLPNEVAFVDDPRPDVKNTRCFENCRDPESVKVTWDSTDLGVTPIDHLDSNESTTQAVEGEQKAPVSVVAVSEKQVNAPSIDAQALYKNSCAMCHDAGIAGAPKTGDKTVWAARIAKPEEKLVANAINGYQGEAGFMPAKGGAMHLSDDEVAEIVRYMIKLVE